MIMITFVWWINLGAISQACMTNRSTFIITQTKATNVFFVIAHNFLILPYVLKTYNISR